MLQMFGWSKKHIFFCPFKEREDASFKNFPENFSAVTAILDGKAIPLRQFNATYAATLYPTPLVKADYMCYKHKPAMISMLFQVSKVS